ISLPTRRSYDLVVLSMDAVKRLFASQLIEIYLHVWYSGERRNSKITRKRIGFLCGEPIHRRSAVRHVTQINFGWGHVVNGFNDVLTNQSPFSQTDKRQSNGYVLQLQKSALEQCRDFCVGSRRGSPRHRAERRSPGSLAMARPYLERIQDRGRLDYRRL